MESNYRAYRRVVAAAIASGCMFAPVEAQVQSPPAPPTMENMYGDDFTREVQAYAHNQQLKSPDGRAYKLSELEEKAIRALQRALHRKDQKDANVALSKAKAAASGEDAKYVVAALQMQMAIGANNLTMQSEALDAIILSGAAPRSSLPMLYRNQGSFALDSGDLAKAESAFSKWVELSPTDAEAHVILAQTKNDARKPAEALKLLERAMALKTASNEEVPETWRQAAKKLSDGLSVAR